MHHSLGEEEDAEVLKEAKIGLERRNAPDLNAVTESVAVIQHEAPCRRTHRPKLIQFQLPVEIKGEDLPHRIDLHDDFCGELNDRLVEEPCRIQLDPSADLDKEGLRLRDHVDGRSSGLAPVPCLILPCSLDEGHLQDAGVNLSLVEIAEDPISKVIDLIRDQVF